MSPFQQGRAILPGSDFDVGSRPLGNVSITHSDDHALTPRPSAYKTDCYIHRYQGRPSVFVS